MTMRAYQAGDVPVLGPIGIAVTGISTVAVAAIGADFLRHGILFHNPNPATQLRILPAGLALVSGAGGIIIEPYGFQEFYDSLGGNAGDSDALVRVNCGWQVVADSAGAAGLTIWNFTDNNQAVPAPEAIAYQNVDVDIASPNAYQQSGLTTVSQQILPANQNRRGLYLHNPGSVYLKGIAPGNLAASLGAGSIVLTPAAAKELRAFGKARVNCAFNAVTANDADGALTALEYV